MPLPGLHSGLVADDLTGATDTALQFRLAGYRAHVAVGDYDAVLSRVLTQQANALTDAEEGAGFGAPNTLWALSTNSRQLPARQAAQQVTQAVDVLQNTVGVEHLYKKMDSTLRGQLAAECLAVLEASRADCMILAPAYPQEGRQMAGGYQLIRGVPLERSHILRDPLFHAWQSHLPTLLAAQCEALEADPAIVGHISLTTVMHGAGPLLAAFQDLIKHNKRLIVVDACSDVDLNQIALAMEKLGKTHAVVPCGSAGLARVLTRQWFGSMPDPVLPEITLPPNPILVVNGSPSETTREQVRWLLEQEGCFRDQARVLALDIAPELLLNLGPSDEAEHRSAALEALMDQAKVGLEAGHLVILSSARREEAFAQTQALAEQFEFENVNTRVQQTLATIAEAVLDAVSATLVVCGGETAARVCRQLGMRHLEVLSQAEPSIPLLCGQATALDGEPMQYLVTKSGSFGGPAALCHVLGYLKQHQEALPV